MLLPPLDSALKTQFPLLSLLHPPPPRGEGAAEAASGKRETATAAATTNRETTESFMADLSRNSSWSKLRTWRKRRGGIYTQVCGRPGHKHGEFQGNHGLFGGIGETTYANELTSPICHKNEETYPGYSHLLWPTVPLRQVAKSGNVASISESLR